MTRYKTPNQRFVEDLQEFISETGQERGNVSAMQAVKALSYLKDNLLDWEERLSKEDGIYLYQSFDFKSIYVVEVTYSMDGVVSLNGVRTYLKPRGRWYGPIDKLKI